MNREPRHAPRAMSATPRPRGGFRRAISGGAIALGVLGAWAAWLQATPMGRAGSGRDDAAEGDDPASAHEGLDDGADERASARPRAPRLPALAARATAAPEPDPDERAAGGERDRAEAGRAAQAARYERARAEWNAQPHDKAWAAETEASIGQALAPRLAGLALAGKLTPIACRSTWCVLDIEAPSSADLGALDGVLRQVSAELAPRYGSAPSARLSEPGPDGTPARARYFLRFRRE
jgi:hypothetical protein